MEVIILFFAIITIGCGGGIWRELHKTHKTTKKLKEVLSHV